MFTVPNTFLAAKMISDVLNAECKVAGEAMDAFPKGAMGLTPDAVRATPEWKAANHRMVTAFHNLRTYNKFFVKKFKKEIAEARNAKYAAITARSEK